MLQFKEREGGKIKKRYDSPKTPYERLLESEHVSEETKEALKEIYKELNPFELYDLIRSYQGKLRRVYLRKKGIVPRLKLSIKELK